MKVDHAAINAERSVVGDRYIVGIPCRFLLRQLLQKLVDLVRIKFEQ
jgi:hypothetical protein